MTDHAAVIKFWCDTFAARTGAKYPFAAGKDGAAIKWLLSIYTADEVRSYMAAFFEMDDPFIEQSGHSLGVFRGCLPKVIRHVQHGPAQSKAGGAAKVLDILNRPRRSA